MSEVVGMVGGAPGGSGDARADSRDLRLLSWDSNQLSFFFLLLRRGWNRQIDVRGCPGVVGGDREQGRAGVDRVG